ncbi:MAG TPA: four helix bundle protein [Polyangia bacterium]|jgi:four helix bundle protein|nr:four helix bundle protein [Polyangia bacterium]
MPTFPHSRLIAYHRAADFVALADGISAELPSGRGYLADQLRRAAASIQANIAEGAGEFSPADKTRFYRMALRSAVECASHLDVCARLKLGDAGAVERALVALGEVVALVTGLVKRFVPSGKGED